MEKVLIKDAHIVNEGTIMRGDVYIEHGIIVEISQNLSVKGPDVHVFDAEGKLLHRFNSMNAQRHMPEALAVLKKDRR